MSAAECCPGSASHRIQICGFTVLCILIVLYILLVLYVLCVLINIIRFSRYNAYNGSPAVYRASAGFLTDCRPVMIFSGRKEKSPLLSISEIPQFPQI